MGKLTTYLIIMSGVTLLFYFMGLLTDCSSTDATGNIISCQNSQDCLCEGKTANSVLLNLAIHPENILNLRLDEIIKLAISSMSTIMLVGVGVFLFNADLVILVPVALLLFNLGWDFLAVFNVVRQANPVLAILIFSPLFIVYALTILEWWRGRD